MWDKLQPLYIELLRIAWTDAADDGIVTGAFDVEREEVQEVLLELAKRVAGIDETTREIIQRVIGMGAEQGWSTERVRDELLERAVTESATRAAAIAQTETATAQSMGSILAYQRSGVVTGIEWLTADNACDVCGPLNGKTVKLGDEFAPGIKHPSAHTNCRCVLLPVV